MGIVGDLERFFGEVVFPNRFVFGGGLALLLGLAAFVAFRRGWDRPLRRHPRVTAVVAVAILAVLLPVGWVLGSPLFVRTSLVEAPPVVVSAEGGSSTAPGGTGAAALLAGSFQGADEFHFGRGRAEVLETADGSLIVQFSDFSVLNGPDLHVYLSPSPDGYAAGAIDLGALKATDGSFSYEIPSGLDLSQVGSVVIWCVPFEVQFAHASLSAP